MGDPIQRRRLGLERLQIAHKIAELNKAFGAIPRGAQGSSSIGKEIRRLVDRRAELEVQLEGPTASEAVATPPPAPDGGAPPARPRRRPR